MGFSVNWLSLLHAPEDIVEIRSIEPMLYFDKRSRTMSDVKGLPPQHAWSERIAQVSMHEFTPVDDAELPEEWRT